MPFCSRCGTRAHERDIFCANCGTRQPVIAPPVADPLQRISPRTASILCYIPTVGWIAAVVVLASQRFRNDRVLRFHAFQGLYLFAAWLFVQWVIRPLVMTLPAPGFRIDHLLHALLLGLWIFMIVKASHEEAFALPIIGELAHRSASE